MNNNMKKDIELTDTTRFLLPCFGISYKRYKELGFLNCFLTDKNRDRINENDIHIYLLFKPIGNQIYLLSKMIDEFEKKDKDHIVLLEDYDYEGGYTILVFKFPERFREDYRLFIEGAYSKFSEDFKKLYPEEKEIGQDEFGTIKGKSLQWMVVNKDPKLKKYQEKKYGFSLEEAPEIYHKIINDNEILDIDTIKHKENNIWNEILNREE